MIIEISVFFIFAMVLLIYAIRLQTKPIAIYFDAYKTVSIKPALIDNGLLKVYNKQNRKGKPIATFLIEDAPQYPFSKSFFSKPAYLCQYGHPKPMNFSSEVNEIHFMEAKTLEKTLDNVGIRNVLSVLDDNFGVMGKIVIIALAVIGLIFIGYFFFVAPNQMSSDLCNNLIQQSGNLTGVYA